MEDFYLLSDATGSMRTAISAVQDRFRNVVQARSEASSDVQFGVGFYRDENDPGFGFVNLQSMTSSISDVLSAIDMLTAEGGGDRPEANLVALYSLATGAGIGWRPDARKIVVYFGDSPGHEPTCFSGVTATRNSVVAALNEWGITVVAASFDGGLDAATSSFGCSTATTSTGPGQGTAITSGTGGALVDSSDQEGLIESIIAAVGSLSQDIEVDTSDCDGKLDVQFQPALPITASPGDMVTITESVTATEAICAEGPEFSCTVRFLAGGGLLGEQVLNARTVHACTS